MWKHANHFNVQLCIPRLNIRLILTQNYLHELNDILRVHTAVPLARYNILRSSGHVRNCVHPPPPSRLAIIEMATRTVHVCVFDTAYLCILTEMATRLCLVY